MNAPIDTTSPEVALVSLDRADADGMLRRLGTEQAATIDRARLRLMEGDATTLHAVSVILDSRVTMPLYRLADAEQAIAVLARKAAKRGLPQPTITEVDRTEREDGSVWVTVRLLGSAPVLNGWRCLATIVPTTINGEVIGIVCTASGIDPLFAWSTRPNACDHCRTNRRRAMTFILAHDDGRTVQVGKTCLNEYVGADALTAWFVFSELRELDDRARGWSDFDSVAHAAWLADHVKAAARKAKPFDGKHPPVLLFLACVAASIRLHGYARRDRYAGIESTGSIVRRLLCSAEHDAPTPEDTARAEQALAWLRDLASREPGSTTDYQEYLVSALLRADAAGGVKAVDATALGSALAASGVAAQRVTNEYVPGAEIGEPLTLWLSLDRDLGWAWSCRDEDGRTILVRKQRSHGLALGTERVQVRATVVDLTTYRGVRQTLVDYARPVA